MLISTYFMHYVYKLCLFCKIENFYFSFSTHYQMTSFSKLIA